MRLDCNIGGSICANHRKDVVHWRMAYVCAKKLYIFVFTFSLYTFIQFGFLFKNHKKIVFRPKNCMDEHMD